MPRKKLVRVDSLPYHVSARTNNREIFPVVLPRLWAFFGNECLFLSLIYGVEFHSAVLMPNHFHVILTTPEFDLGVVMQEFMRSISRYCNTVSGRSGHTFGGPYHWSLIADTHYFGHATKYVYRNPVKAGLCERVEDYPFSSLYGLLGRSKLSFPVCFTRRGLESALPSSESYELLPWLNEPFPQEAEQRIQKGLRRRYFGKIIDRKTGRPYEPFTRLI